MPPRPPRFSAGVSRAQGSPLRFSVGGTGFFFPEVSSTAQPAAARLMASRRNRIPCGSQVRRFIWQPAYLATEQAARQGFSNDPCTLPPGSATSKQTPDPSHASRDCGIILPMPALPSNERGRFQGRPLESSLGGTGTFFLGSSIEAQLTMEKAATHKASRCRSQVTRFMVGEA